MTTPLASSLTTRRTTPEDAALLGRLWLLFRHEMSAITGTLPNPDGGFRRERLDAALTDPGWCGVLAQVTPRSDGGPEQHSPKQHRPRQRHPGQRHPGQRHPGRSDPGRSDPGPRGAEPRPVGFALVRGLAAPTRVLNSFFVVGGARRAGVGRRFAAEVLALFPGPWEIAFQDVNAPAVHFWRAVATDAVGEAWTEERRPVPARPDLPPDTWISFTTSR